MNRSDVTKEQAKKLSQGLYPVQNYLYRLRRRMEQVGFPLTDPVVATGPRASPVTATWS